MVRAILAPLRPLSVLTVALLLGSCTGDDAGIRRLPLEPSASPGKLAITPDASTLTWIGAKGQLAASIATADGGSISGVKYSWASLDPAVVTVDQTGAITSVQEGNARVVVSVLNLADTARVTVKRLPAAVALSADTALITEFESNVQLTATITDGGGAVLETPVIWSSSDTAVARVSSSGLVTTAGTQGVSTITALAGTVTKTARIRVKVGPSTIQVTPNSVALTALGDTLRLAGTVLNARGDLLANIPVTFTWVDTLVAHVTSDGLVTARGVGTTQVTAVGDTIRRVVQVAVTQTPTTLTMSPGAVTIVPGATQVYTAAAKDRNGNAIPSPTVTWLSSDTVVATVSSTGSVKAKAAGTAVIRANAGAAKDSAVVTVLNAGVDSLAVSQDSVALDPGVSLQLSAQTFFGTTPLVGPVVTWSSDSTAIATVSASGLVRAVSQGSTWIRATAAAADSMSTPSSDSVRVTVNAPPSAFNIVIQYVGTTLPTDAQKAAFAAAEFKWENIILGDLPPGTPNLTAGACGNNHPAFNSLVDDLLIFVEVTAIDGVNGILASAGPCVVRGTSGLALVGNMKMDSADLASLEASGQLTETITHEMGHVLGLGVGTPWTGILIGAGGADPYWPGTTAVAQFDLAGGTSINKVPVANTGGEGTQDAHWREATMGRELMTGFLNGGVSNPLSAITIGAMKDMGYVVDLTQGDTYTVSGSLRAGPSRGGVELRETLFEPRFVLDASGALRLIRQR